MIKHQRNGRKTAVIVTINVAVALLHFITGPQYTGPFPIFVNGYLIDILLPFAFYFLLCLNSKFGLLQLWFVKALIVFGAAALVEVTQFFGISLFGQTFDPLDFVMYGLGAGLAVIFDTLIFPRVFNFWKS